MIGHAKPDVRAFRHVLDALGLPGEEVAFADDSPSKLVGAAALGMPTLAFTDAAALRAWLVTATIGRVRAGDSNISSTQAATSASWRWRTR